MQLHTTQDTEREVPEPQQGVAGKQAPGCVAVAHKEEGETVTGKLYGTVLVMFASCIMDEYGLYIRHPVIFAYTVPVLVKVVPLTKVVDCLTGSYGTV